MKKKNSKKFLILSISGAFVLITGIILACADFGYEDFYNSFFAPETSHADEYKPFFRSNNKFYGNERFESTISNFDSINIVEWRNFFGSKVTRADMKFLVYRSRIGEVDSLIFYLKDNKYSAKSYLKYNSIYSFEDKTAIKEFLYYLGFAKRCEPFALFNPDWWDDAAKAKDPRNNKLSMLKLIEGGSKALANVKSEFVRQRYIFQIIRLYYNAKEFGGCVTYYNAHSDAFNVDNTIKYRSMGYAAGAYYKQKKYSEANYLYASIYDKCEEMKVAAFLSFHPQEDADWNGSLQLTKNDREKAALWHLLGVYADPVRAMKQIYALDPKSDLLDLLLVRAVNIAEESFIPSPYNYSEKKDSSYALNAIQVNPEMLSFMKEVADKKNTNKPYLWSLATGYLCLASSDFKVADKYLKSAEKEVANDKLVADQVRAFRLISKIEQYSSVTEKTEAELAKELIWINKEKHDPNLRNSEIYRWALHRLSQKYRAFGDLVKAQCLDIAQDKQFYDNPDKMKAMIAFIDKPNKTEFEQFIFSIHPYSRANLFEYQAIGLIYQYNFRDALAEFDECKGSGNDELLGDPFVIHINDCHDCDHIAHKDIYYTKYSFVKRLAELEEFSSSDSKKVSEAYFLLANGLYNMTYFGNARSVYATPIKENYLVFFNYNSYNTNKLDFIEPIYNCTKAKECYRKAMELSVDKEFKAECCFMAAKCEQNAYFCSSEFNNKRAVKSGKYFQQLQETYSKTNYYKEVLEDCGYFSMYQANWILKHPK